MINSIAAITAINARKSNTPKGSCKIKKENITPKGGTNNVAVEAITVGNRITIENHTAWQKTIGTIAEKATAEPVLKSR